MCTTNPTSQKKNTHPDSTISPKEEPYKKWYTIDQKNGQLFPGVLYEELEFTEKNQQKITFILMSYQFFIHLERCFSWK